MLRWLKRRRASRRAEALLPGRAEFEALCRSKPAFCRLTAAERGRLRQRAAWVLATKSFHGAAGLEPGWDDCLPVAAHAALLLLGLEPEWLDGFHTFILYTDAFEVEIDEIDDLGLAHRGRDLRAGEAWERGPVVLSLADVAASGLGDGYDVVVHELAHQIDQLSGEANGFPPLPPEMSAREWSATMREAYDRLCDRLDAGAEATIDPYAAESPAEFFAVASEYFFDAPDRLAQSEPAVHSQLERLYRPARDTG